MKTRKTIFGLVLLLAIFLAACSPQATPTEVMSDKEMSSESMEEDAMMSGQDDQMMDDKEDDMMAENDDEMMGDNEEDAMMSDHDDQMASEKDDDMMGEKEEDAMMSDHDDQMASEIDDDMMADKDDQMMSDQGDQMAPDWFKASLTNARTGETFTVADFKGKVVLVETLAMWCSNCLKQQGQVLALHDLIGERDDFVSLGVDIDPNENAAALSSYIDKNGFDWLYTVAPTEVAREIGQLYGDQYLNPPSTPMLIIDRDGEVHLLPFGIKSAESLLESLQAFLDEEM